MAIPRCGRLNLFHSKCREDEMRITRLPGERFGFIQNQSEQVLLPVQSVERFREDRGFDCIKLRQQFPAAGAADVKKSRSAFRLGPTLIQVSELHISFGLSLICNICDYIIA
jgi:hypothetical protein